MDNYFLDMQYEKYKGERTEKKRKLEREIERERDRERI